MMDQLSNDLNAKLEISMEEPQKTDDDTVMFEITGLDILEDSITGNSPEISYFECFSDSDSDSESEGSSYANDSVVVAKRTKPYRAQRRLSNHSFSNDSVEIIKRRNLINSISSLNYDGDFIESVAPIKVAAIEVKPMVVAKIDMQRLDPKNIMMPGPIAADLNGLARISISNSAA